MNDGAGGAAAAAGEPGEMASLHLPIASMQQPKLSAMTMARAGAQPVNVTASTLQDRDDDGGIAQQAADGEGEWYL